MTDPTLELATQQDAERWRKHLEHPGPYKCSGSDDHLPSCGGTCGEESCPCLLTCVVPEEYVAPSINSLADLVGQQVTLVLAPPPDLRGGTGVRNMEFGTATVVNVVKVWREFRELERQGGISISHMDASRLLMGVEVKPCSTD